MASGLDAKITPNDKLAKIIGAAPITRGNSVKKFWEYVKKNNLQAGRNINCDANLKPLSGKDVITMFEVGGIISKNSTK